MNGIQVHAPNPDDAWQATVARYLARRRDVGPISVFEVLRSCEGDAVMRAAYLRMAREIMP